MRGSQFRETREKAELTQRRVAELFDLTVATISRWEKQETVPPYGEFALRWITHERSRPTTRDERQAEESRRGQAHVAHMREIEEQVRHQHEEEARERRLAEIERKHPGIFGDNTSE